MGKRKELGSFASGIINSFNSRNNDYDGYWGVGILYSFALKNSVTEVEIDLLNNVIIPETNNYDVIINEYKNMLLDNLNSRNIPISWVCSAKIYIEYESEWIPKYHFWRCALGKPCIMKCLIIDDTGITHSSIAYNNCSADYQKFSRSVRRNLNK